MMRWTRLHFVCNQLNLSLSLSDSLGHLKIIFIFISIVIIDRDSGFDTRHFAHTRNCRHCLFFCEKEWFRSQYIRNTHHQLTLMSLRFVFYFCIIWWNYYAKKKPNATEKQVQQTAAWALSNADKYVCSWSWPRTFSPGDIQIFANVAVLRQYCAYTHRNSFYDHVCAQTVDEIILGR